MSDRLAVFNDGPDRAGRGAGRGLRATRRPASWPGSSGPPTCSAARSPRRIIGPARHVHDPAREDPPGASRRATVGADETSATGTDPERRLPRPRHALRRRARRRRPSSSSPSRTCRRPRPRRSPRQGKAVRLVWKRQHQLPIADGAVIWRRLRCGPRGSWDRRGGRDRGRRLREHDRSVGASAAAPTAVATRPRARQRAPAASAAAERVRCGRAATRSDRARARSTWSPGPATSSAAPAASRSRATTGSRRSRPRPAARSRSRSASTPANMVQLMKTGQYDGVSASGDATLRLIAGGDVAPVNFDLIPNYKDVFEGLKNQSYNTVNGVGYGVPHGRGANVLMYDPTVVTTAPDSWSVVFDANSPYKGKVTAYNYAIYIADAALYLMKTQARSEDHQPVRPRQGPARGRRGPAQGPEDPDRQVLGHRAGGDRRLRQRRHGDRDRLALPAEHDQRRRRQAGRRA